MGRSEGSGALPSEFFINARHQAVCVSMATRYSRNSQAAKHFRAALNRDPENSFFQEQYAEFRRQQNIHGNRRRPSGEAETGEGKYSVNPYLIEHNLININQLWRRSISALWMMVRRNRKEVNELRLEATG